MFNDGEIESSEKRSNFRQLATLQRHVFRLNDRCDFLFLRPLKEPQSEGLDKMIEDSVSRALETHSSQKPEVYVVRSYAPKFHERDNER